MSSSSKPQDDEEVLHHTTTTGDNEQTEQHHHHHQAKRIDLKIQTSNNDSQQNAGQEEEEEEIASPKIVIGPLGSVNSTNALPAESQIIHHHPKGSVPKSTGIWKTLDDLIIHNTWMKKDEDNNNTKTKTKTEQNAKSTDDDQQQQLLEAPTETVKCILEDTAPSAARASATQIMMYVNQAVAVILVSHILGSDKLAPFAVAISFFNVCSASIIVGLSVAMETLASQSYGHNPRSPDVGHHVQFNLSLVYACAIPLSIFFWNSYPVVVLLFGDQLAPGIAEFLKAGPFYLYCFATRAVLNRAMVSTKRAHIPLYGMFAAVAAFPVIAYFLIPYGLFWAGVSLSISSSIHIVVMIILAYRDKESFVHFVSWTPSEIVSLWTKERFTIFMGLAIPTAGTVLLSWWVQEALMWIGSRMSLDRVAALTIVLNLSQILFVVMLGVGVAIASGIGNRLGANEPANAKACMKVLLAFSIFISVVNSLFALIFGKFIFRLYTHEEDVLVHLHSVLPLLCLFHLVEGTQLSIHGVFRGTGEQKSLVPLQFVSMWLFAVPLMWLVVNYLDQHISGLMWAFIAGFLVQIPWSTYLTTKWDWKKLAQNAAERREGAAKKKKKDDTDSNNADHVKDNNNNNNNKETEMEEAKNKKGDYVATVEVEKVEEVEKKEE